MAEELLEYGLDIDADFRQVYGLDVAVDLATPRLPWWRFRSLLERLPDSSRYVAARAEIPLEDRMWNMDRQLQAALFDRLGTVMYLQGALLAPNLKGGKNPFRKPPEPLPRPGVEEKKTTRGTGMSSLVRTLSASGAGIGR